MKSIVKASVAVVLAASVVSAQLDQLPDCARNCLSQINVVSRCANNVECVCNSQAFQDGFAPCISYGCSAQDYQAISDATEALCSSAGETVTVTVEAPAPTRSTPPELARFPGCARDCVSQLNAIAGCPETDFKCFCGSNAFFDGFNPCISLLCDPSDYGATSDAAESLCADNGVSVTVTATTPSPFPTSVETSSSPAESTDGPSETTGAEETSGPAETTGAEETSGPAETTGPGETSAPVTTSMATVPVPGGNRTSSGSGSTPTSNGGARHTAFAGVLGAALLFGAAML